MSGRLVGEVLDYAPTDLTPLQRLVLVCIAEDARERDRTARYTTSLTDLEKRTCAARGSVKNALGELTRRGLIKPLHRAQIGTVQHYRLTELYEHHREAVIRKA